MDMQNIGRKALGNQAFEDLVEALGGRPREAVSSRTPLDAGEAVAFLKRLDPDGWHNLVAIDPATGHVAGRTFEPGQWEHIASWIDARNGEKNLYFTVNEPCAGAPHDKLKKMDIGRLRFIFCDADPRAGEPLDVERARLAALADSVANKLPPTFVVDSGGGVQFFWQLESKLNPESASEWAESQGRGIAAWLGGDPVQNIDRLMRLPGTLNIPTAVKIAKGRTSATVARVLSSKAVTYDQMELASVIEPIWSALRSDSSEEITRAIKDLNQSEILDAESYANLPLDLRSKLEGALGRNHKLRELWEHGATDALVGTDQTGSGYRASLARRLAETDDFSAEEYAALAMVWEFATIPGDNRELKLSHRNLARDWVRMGLPFSVTRWLEPEDQETIIPPELAGRREPSNHAQPLQWLDPTAWENRPLRDREWEVEGWIPRHEVTLLYGEGGIGKTLLAHQYATCAATALPWLGQKTRPARVMCFFCEDSEDELHRRQSDINKVLGVGFSDLSSLRIVSRKHEDNVLALWDRGTGAMKLQPVWHQLLADAIAFQADVVIVDTIADTFGGSEIDRAQVNAFVKNCLGALARGINGSVIALGHPSQSGKSSGSGTSGSTAWGNASRSRLYLRYPKGIDKGNIRELEGMKSNYGPKGSLLKVQWQRGAFDVLAGSVPAGSITPGAFPSLEDAAERAVISALIDCQGEQMSAARNSGYYGPKVLKRLAPEALLSLTDDEIASAMDRLQARKVLSFGVIGKNASRHPVKSYILSLDKLSADAAGSAGAFE